MTTQHPKITIYVPQPILDALDAWKFESGIESRSGATVAILADYLEVQYPVQQQGNVPLAASSNALSTVLAELVKLSERVTALEQQMAASTALIEVPDTAPISSPRSTVLIEAPGTVPREDAASVTEVGSNVPSTAPRGGMATASEVQNNVPSTVPSEEATTASVVQGKALSTVPIPDPFQTPDPLTQMALAKRFGVSDKAVEKHRKHGLESFAQWSRARDPDTIAWTWEGGGGRGQPLRFVPLD